MIASLLVRAFFIKLRFLDCFRLFSHLTPNEQHIGEQKMPGRELRPVKICMDSSIHMDQNLHVAELNSTWIEMIFQIDHTPRPVGWSEEVHIHILNDLC